MMELHCLSKMEAEGGGLGWKFECERRRPKKKLDGVTFNGVANDRRVFESNR